MKYRIGDSARLVTSYRGYSLVTIIDYEGDRYWVALTSGFKLVVREDELEDV
ncbi:MAG TPA: adhesin [Candidatus Bilophila faecipullorum]|uniref:Adhesin n=1 Tax=Candidatus Bilophila faecipullorum TaxID=2838482 RepID=A0A9D1QZS6_9BACT|nr:adhesin [Candidatus Bilophila faecipullorum]